MGSRYAVVTTATTYENDAAVALGRSAAEHWPAASVYILASTRLHARSPEPTWVAASSVDQTGFVSERILSEPDEVAVALPFLLKRLVAEHGVCVYVVPDLVFSGIPEHLCRLAEEVGTAIAAPAPVTPTHSLTPSLGRIGSDWAVSPRAIAVTVASLPIIDSWIEAVVDGVLDVDQRDVAWVASAFLHQAVSRAGVVVDGERTLLHWSAYAAVVAGRAEGHLPALVDCRSLFVSARGQDEYDDAEVAWSQLVHRVHDARPVEPLFRLISDTRQVYDGEARETPYELFRAAVWRAADPYGRRWGRGDSAAVDDWLFEENTAGCSRLAHLAILVNPELFQEFPTVAFDPKPFQQWLAEGGRNRLGFDPFDRGFVPVLTAPKAKAEVPSGIGHALHWRWNLVKRLIPGHGRRVETRQREVYMGRDPRRGLGAAPPRGVVVNRVSPSWGVSPRGLNLIGPLRSESGLGQAARASLGALRLLGRPFTHVDITDKYPSRNALDVGLTWDTYGQLGGVNLLHLNADETLTLGLTALKHRLGGRFNAAMWFWESGLLPDRSRGAFRVVDELWVASNYLRDVFGQYARVPVHVIGLAAELPQSAPGDRSRLGWSDDELVFLFVFDALSSYGRKNPGKALQAFTRAFAPDYRGVRFVLKVSNLNKFPEMQKDIYRYVEANPAITIIDEYLERSEVLELMAAADVYVSLHAAEGFGLTLLEAMALGTPVICTGYSGNLDFTTAENSWLVGYDMIQTDRRHGPYPLGAVWADPRVDDAADIMRHVAQHRDEIVVKAVAAVRDARRAASIEEYARRLDTHLRRVL